MPPDTQTMTQQPQEIPASVSPTAINPEFFQMLARQMGNQDTSGLTSMQPNLQPVAPIQRPQQPMQRIPPAQAVGVGQGGAVKRQAMQNLTAQISNAAGQIAQAVQAKKNREYLQVTTQFTSLVKGINDAKGQLQQGQQLLQQAQQEQDPQKKQQMMQQGQQMVQTAQQSLQQNTANYNDMVNDPKKHKVITKAFGIDDKNANSPERQAAIQAIQKQNQGMSPQGANVMSRLPQTQQLSPEAQQRAMAVQSGVMGKPRTETSTPAQMINAMTNAQKAQFQHEAQQKKLGLDTDKFIADLPKKGLVAVTNDSGDVVRNQDGTIKTRNLSMEDLKDNPELYEQYKRMQSQVDLNVARAKDVPLRTAIMKQREARIAADNQQMMQLAKTPGVMQSWAKNLSDPSSGVTLAQVPAKMRSAVIGYMAQNNMKLSKPLTGDEIKRADLAGNAVSNLEAAQAILARRPDMFGPGGWGKTKFEYAIAGGDQDALDFKADIELANLPLLGIHSQRSKYGLEGLKNLDGDLYLNPASMGAVLNDFHRSASEFQKSGGRQTPESSGSDSGATDSSTDIDNEIMKAVQGAKKP